jgi:hypothetical protein|nr:MAG TPA: endosialidase chaperone [Caudoviricetes sp.]
MYETSEKWKQNIYENTVCAMNIYIDDVLVNPDYILDFKKGGNAFEEEFCLGGTPSQYVEMKLYKDKMPESLKKIRVEYGILINHALTVAEVNAMLVGTLNGIPVKSLSSNDSSFEMIPIGIYNVDDYTDNDDNTITIKALDNMIKFEFNYDGRELISKGEATLLEVAQDICKKAGVELNSTSFLNSDKKVAVYDNTVTARKYISYIAESAGGFACIDRKGKLCFRKFYQDETEIPLEIFGEYKWGEEFKISKVSYEDGIRSFKFGDDTRNNLWINQENMYIVDEDQVQKIYNEIKDLTSNTFEGKTVIDPAIDLGDKIVIDGKNVIYQGEMSLEGSFIAQISSKIQIKQKEETTVKKESQKVVNRKVQSRIDQAEGKIEQLVEETSEQSQKLTKVEQTVDSISQKVSDIEDLTRTAEEIKTVTLENCIEANLLELHIYGNNTVFNYLLLDDKLTLDDNLHLEGDDLISVTDKDNNIKTYSLGITEALRQNSEVCDEVVLENGQAKVIRRVNKSGSTKAKESVEDLGKLEIPLKEGTNTITINNYTARIKAKYVIKSTYSDTFATKVEMNSEIKQTKESVDLSVNKKLEDYSTTTEMNSAISLKAGEITSSVSKTYETKENVTKQYSNIKQTTDNITSVVGKKVGNDEIISKINQSAESVTILASKLGLTANDVLDLISNNVLNLTAKNLVIQSTYFNVNKDGKVIITGNKNLIIGNTKSNYVALDPGEISLWNTSGGNLSIMPNALVMMDNYNSSSITPNEINTPKLTADEISAQKINQSSLEEKKKNFEKMKDNALEIINGIDIYRYNLKTENDKDKKHIGFVIGDKYNYSKEVTSLDNTGVDTYSFVSLCCKAIQELHAQIGNMHKEIEKLKGAKE